MTAWLPFNQRHIKMPHQSHKVRNILLNSHLFLFFLSLSLGNSHHPHPSPSPPAVFQFSLPQQHHQQQLYGRRQIREKNIIFEKNPHHTHINSNSNININKSYGENEPEILPRVVTTIRMYMLPI